MVLICVDVEEDRAQDRDADFVRACAIDMHVNMSREALVDGNSEVKKMKKLHTSWSTLIKHRPLLPPQEPLCVDTLFKGKSTDILDCPPKTSRARFYPELQPGSFVKHPSNGWQ